MSTAKPWGRIGAWAAEAEAAEAEELAAAAAAAAAATATADTESFPSLKEAVSTKTKKKKGPTMSLSEFHTSGSSSIGKGLTPDEMLRLPTGPRERTQEELESSRGFRYYGGVGGVSGRRDDGAGGRRGFGGFEEDSGRRGGARSDFEGPSRADEAESWGSTKKSVDFGRRDDGGGGRRGFGGFDEDSGRRGGARSDFVGPSRADEVEDWGSMKKTRVPSFSGEVSGGRIGGSKADEMDNWAVGKKPIVPPLRQSTFGSGPSDSDRWARGSASHLPRNGDRERPRLVLEPRKVDVVAAAAIEVSKTSKSNPFGAARPREEVLAEKGMDWRRLEAEIDTKKTSRPTSSQSSRPSSAHSNRAQSPSRQLLVTDTIAKARPKVNPFGDAKPREVVLQEKGQDWKKIDFELEHRGVDRPDTDEEKKMKDEINVLNKLLSKDTKSTENGEYDRFTPEELDNLQQQKEILERDLEQLAHELDDKIRFGQKASERRPGSGSGRSASQLVVTEDARSAEFTDRPRSRGGGSDSWSRSGDDRRTYNLGSGGGFLGSRNTERAQSRERW